MSTQIDIDSLLTVEDLDIMPEDGNRYEIIEGELFVSPLPNLKHQRVSRNIVGIFSGYLDHNPIGEILYTPGVIFSNFSGVIPDLVFVSSEQRDEIASGDRIMGAPVLVIEIISPGAENLRRDRLVKKQLYAKYDVKEYWLVDPETRAIEAYVLENGLFELRAVYGEGDELTSELLSGFRCKVEDIFRV
ncbi:MAG TPA: Uma2 family endonuclease [Blastocatellia bacterium]|nr:Uma2 family endonuclease [Blastocatellia bacterium]